MVYFKGNGMLISDVKDENLIGSGMSGRVYLLDGNKCLKIYNEDSASRLSKDVFSLLKVYRLDNYYALYDLVYDENKNNVGYISEYYKPSENNLLLMPMEYIIDNYAKIYNSSMILSNNGIITKDLYHANVIIGDEQMTIIDVDSYAFDERDYTLLKSTNVRYLVYLFFGMYQEEAAKLGIELAVDKKSFDIVKETFYEGDLTPKTLNRKLSPYKRGIDLIRR